MRHSSVGMFLLNMCKSHISPRRLRQNHSGGGGGEDQTLVKQCVNETFTQAVYVVVMKKASFIPSFHYLAQSLRGLVKKKKAGEEGGECAYQLILRVGGAEFLIDCPWIWDYCSASSFRRRYRTESSLFFQHSHPRMKRAIDFVMK